jgi:hypothetical protein
MDDLGGNTMDTDSVKNKRKRELMRTGRIVPLVSQLREGRCGENEA